jgi:hypothetical protein
VAVDSRSQDPHSTRADEVDVDVHASADRFPRGTPADDDTVSIPVGHEGPVRVCAACLYDT